MRIWALIGIAPNPPPTPWPPLLHPSRRQREPAQLPGAVPRPQQQPGAVGGRHCGALPPGPGVAGKPGSPPAEVRGVWGSAQPGGWWAREDVQWPACSHGCGWQGRGVLSHTRHPALSSCVPASAPFARPQSSQVQLFVVRNINGELKPFNVRAVTTGEAELPTHNTELAIGM